ncbi:TonB-dependent receptor [Marinilabilia rubra]|uniref:TonB-dependent receptor n=1 Tax=Marinilabilia rubra TaxID=2162893 RepID=A0A2U2BC46_9BACT|nr:TonB-dependent receptor [Marinilabilia rubra]PWE00645.1 TonB-dependent receptor [Marinilabilia rubra]
MERHILIYISLLLFLSPQATGNPTNQAPTQNIRGRILDKDTMQPLPGANVILISSSPTKGTISNEDGYYELRNIQVGRVSLKFSFLGYHPQLINNVSLSSGKELILNIQLEEKVIMGEEITIVGKRRKDRPSNEMAKVSARSFTVEESERYAGSRNDVARMAQNYAGVAGNDDSRNDIVIRGNSPTGLLWRLEGMDIPNPNHFGATGTTGGPVSMLNNSLLTNSDFMTSAFPAEYGNATAGVFDLKMRQGNNRNYEFIGQVGFNGFEAGAEGPFSTNGNSSFLINYRYSSLSLFDKLGFNFGTSGIPYYQDLSFKADFSSTTLGKTSIFGLGGISDIEIRDSREKENSESDLYTSTGFDLTNGVYMGLAGISSSKILNETTYLKTTLGISGHRNRVIRDSLSEDRTSKFANYRSFFVERNLNISSYINKKFNKHHIFKGGFYYKKLGYNYNDSAYNRDLEVLEVITNESGRTSLWQPWTQWLYKISDQLEITTGLRLSYFGLTEETVIEPRAAITWHLKPGQALSLGYGLHSQTAPLYLYFSEVRNQQGEYIRPNLNLPMTKSRHLVLSYDKRLGEKTRLKLETYYQHLFDVAVDQSQNTSYSMLNEGANFYISFPDYLQATGTGWNYGLEMTLERFLHDGFYYLFTGSVFESKYKDSSGNVHSTAFNNNFVFNLLVGKEFIVSSEDAVKRKSINADVKTTWSGGKRKTPFDVVLSGGEYEQNFNYNQTFGIRLKDYFRTDLSFGYRIDGKKVTQEWGIEISNLFDTRNIFDEDFERKTGNVDYTYQLGLLIVPHFRIIF